MPRRCPLLFATALLFGAGPLRADDTNLFIRAIPVSPSFFEMVPAGKDVKGFFENCGLTFPAGASITYNPGANRLYHRNTEVNQLRLADLWRLLQPEPVQIRIDAVFVDFSKGEIARLARTNSTPGVRPEDLLRLWKDGQGSLLHALKLVTVSGSNTQIQAVSEHIYSAEFNPPAPHAAETAASPLPVPGAFETREAGAIFNVTPFLMPDGKTIDVVLAPELATKPDWQSLPVTGTDTQGNAIQLSIPRPVFHSRNIATCIVVQDGKTAVLGGMENPAGDGFTYLFLTATVIGPDGEPAR